jgi:hypothetical protein
MMYDEICGLPKIIQVYDAPKIPCGAMHPGNDVSTVVCCDSNRKVMELVMFNTPALIHGLLIWEREKQRLSFSKDASFPPPRHAEHYFFGYKCSRCKEIYLLPDSVKKTDEIPAAMQHECVERL